MSIRFPKFFEGNDYFIDQKVNFLKFASEYKVFNEQGEQIGSIKQRLTGGQKVLRLFLKKAMLPFTLEIVNSQDELQAVIQRGWTFWMSKITVTDPSGDVVGVIKQKFAFFKNNFEISDVMDNAIASIKGDWKAWNFSILNPDGIEIGAITKKWAGAMKEVFTSADKYYVSIVPQYAEDSNKIAIVATAITIDMVLKEGKN